MQASDLNNFSVTTVTASGAITAGTTLASGTTLAAGTSLAVGTSATVATTLAVTGITTLSNQLNLAGASAGQIVFPATQNPSTNANTLDDYEEGTWTPVIGGSGGTSGQVYSFQVGKYVKVGKLVTAYFSISMTTKGTITTSVQIQGLPFTTENTANLKPSGVISFWNNTVTSFVNLSLVADPNTTAATIYGAAAAATAPTALVTADLNNATDLIGSITYAATA